MLFASAWFCIVEETIFAFQNNINYNESHHIIRKTFLKENRYVYFNKSCIGTSVNPKTSMTTTNTVTVGYMQFYGTYSIFINWS